VLFDPARSADPPISILLFLTRELIIDSEDFLEARILYSFKAIFFSFKADLIKSFLKNLFILLFFFL
jgi:hypothetical protein